MSHGRFAWLSFIALSVLAVLSYCAPALVARQGVTEVTVTASPQSYNGPCPGRVKFTGTIHIDRYPMTLNYQWERSDGAKGPVKVVHVPSAKTRSITAVDYWQVSARGRLQIRERLHVRTGKTDIASSAATATVNCR
jgi:multidrug efflux pump subunit AcrA (membrane-fusion protein)